MLLQWLGHQYVLRPVNGNMQSLRASKGTSNKVATPQFEPDKTNAEATNKRALLTKGAVKNI